MTAAQRFQRVTDFHGSTSGIPRRARGDCLEIARTIGAPSHPVNVGMRAGRAPGGARPAHKRDIFWQLNQ
jgi:hypothetical protein